MAKPNAKKFGQRLGAGFQRVKKIIGKTGKIARKFLNTANAASGGKLKANPRFLAAYEASRAGAKAGDFNVGAAVQARAQPYMQQYQPYLPR